MGKTLFVLLLASLAAGSASAQKKVVVVGSDPAMVRELQAAAPNLKIVGATGGDVAKEIVDADAVIGSVSSQALAAGKKLQWVQTNSAGVEGIVGELRTRPVTLTNCKILQGPNIADHAMALLLTLTRALYLAQAAKAKEEWERGGANYIELSGKTAVVIGVGGIGMQIAQRAHGFGMNVIGVDPKEISYTYFLKQVVRPERLDEVLPLADVVFVSAPLTGESKGMMGAKQFQSMKKGSYFVAVSRGGLYDTPALMKALDSKQLAGAGLDVTNPEPLPKGHPLWKFDNVVITPHVAGQSDLVNTRRMEVYKENLRRFAAGAPLVNVVDKEKGY